MSKQIVALDEPAVSTDRHPDRRVAKLFCGIDIGAETLAIAVMELDHPCVQREFANTVNRNCSIEQKRAAVKRVGKSNCV